MTLDGIDVFVRVVQEGSFAAAARQLAMPTSTVSAKIARLEERLGVTLIRRSTRRMHLTAAGDAYFAACVSALNALDAGQSRIAAGSAGPRGLLRLTAPSDLASALLAPLCARYLELYPETRIDLVVTNRRLDLVGEGIDLALRVGQLRDSTMVSRKFEMGDIGLWASAAYVARCSMPRSGADLANHELIGFTVMPEGQTLLATDGRSLELPSSRRITTDDLQVVRAFAATGAGIGLLPEIMAREDRLVRVLPEYGIRLDFAFFVYPAQRHVTANVRAFIDLALSRPAKDSVAGT